MPVFLTLSLLVAFAKIQLITLSAEGGWVALSAGQGVRSVSSKQTSARGIYLAFALKTYVSIRAAVATSYKHCTPAVQQRQECGFYREHGPAAAKAIQFYCHSIPCSCPLVSQWGMASLHRRRAMWNEKKKYLLLPFRTPQTAIPQTFPKSLTNVYCLSFCF